MQKTRAKSTIYDVLLIAALGLLSLTWFRGHFLINPGDTNFSFNPPHDLYRSLFVWDHEQGLGRLDSMATAKIFPYNFLLAIMYHLGISIYGSQKILFYLLFTGSGLTAYFLIKYLLTSKIHNRLAALLSANFYMMNTYLIQLRWGSGYIMGLFFYVMFPFLVLMWLQGRATKNIKCAIYMILGLALALPSLNNPAYVAPLFVIAALDLCIQFFKNATNKQELVALLKYIFVATSAFFLGLSFWIVSILVTLRASTASLAKSTLQFRQEVVTGSASSIFNLLRNLGDWGFWAAYEKDYYYPYSHVYQSPIFIGIGFAIMFLCFASLSSLKKQGPDDRYNIVLFSLVFVVGIWLSKGTHPPFGSIYTWAVRHTFFAAFRAAYEKFGTLIVLGTMVLIAFSLSHLLEQVKNKNAKLVLILTSFALINIYAWPFWSGDIWRNETSILPGFRFQIPEYYNELKRFLAKSTHQDGRLLELPDNALPVPGIISLRFNGRHYTGSDPLGRILETPIIYLNQFNFSVSDRLTSLLFQSYSANLRQFVAATTSFSEILDAHSVLLRNDSDNTLYTNIRDPAEIKPLLKSLKFIKSFGKLDLYSIADRNFPPQIYPSAMPTIIVGGMNDFATVFTIRDLEKKVVLLTEFLAKEQTRSVLAKSSEIVAAKTQPVSAPRKSGTDQYQIPRRGQYELLFRPKDHTTDALPNLFLKKDDSTLSATPVLRPDGWFSLGTLSFTKGKHRLLLSARATNSGRFTMNDADVVLRKRSESTRISPNIAFKRVNPTKYAVRTSANSSYFLVFSESFHRGWKAYYGKVNWWQALWRQPISENKHFLVNGYANAWYIDKPGKYDLTLYFWPQSLFYIGLIISGLTLLSCFGYLVYDWQRTRYVATTG